MATARARNIYEDDDAGKMVFLPEIDNPSKQTSFSRGKHIVYIELTPYTLLHFFSSFDMNFFVSLIWSVKGCKFIILLRTWPVRNLSRSGKRSTYCTTVVGINICLWLILRHPYALIVIRRHLFLTCLTNRCDILISQASAVTPHPWQIRTRRSSW